MRFTDRKRPVYLAAIFAAILPVAALAQGNDPKILIGGDGLGPPPISTIGHVQPGCNNGFGIPGTDQGGDPTCTYFFTNNTGNILDGFTFDTTFSFTPPEGESYACDGSSLGFSCSATLTMTNGVYNLDYVFSGGSVPTGPDPTFWIELDNWSGNFATVTLTNSYAVPEASALLILLTELLLFVSAVALFRRKLNWKHHLNL
jgi:hypothetical protein